MLLKNTGLFTITLLGAVGCHTPEGHSWDPHVGFQTTVSGSMDLSVPGYGITSSYDYSSTEFMVGALRTSAGEMRPIKHEFAGFLIGRGGIKNAGANFQGMEFSGGGRVYMDKGQDFVPYFSIFSTITGIDTINGIGVSHISPQIGIRIGVGGEYIIAENFSFDLGADYLFPLNGFNEYGFEFELSGIAIRIGVSTGF